MADDPPSLCRLSSLSSRSHCLWRRVGCTTGWATRGAGWGARRGGLRTVRAGALSARADPTEKASTWRELAPAMEERRSHERSGTAPGPCELTCWDWRCVRPWQALAEAAACAGGERRGRCFNFFRGKKCQLRNRTVADRRGRGGWRRREETQEVDTRDGGQTH